MVDETPKLIHASSAPLPFHNRSSPLVATRVNKVLFESIQPSSVDTSAFDALYGLAEFGATELTTTTGTVLVHDIPKVISINYAPLVR